MISMLKYFVENYNFLRIIVCDPWLLFSVFITNSHKKKLKYGHFQ